MALCEKLGLDKDVYSVSIPLGATINMDGAAITITIMTLAAANTLGMRVSVPAAVPFHHVCSGRLRYFWRGRWFAVVDSMACSLFGISNDIAYRSLALASSSASFRIP